MKAKFVNESVFKGPSEEDVWQRVRRYPQEALHHGLFHDNAFMIAASLKAGAELGDKLIGYIHYNENELIMLKEAFEERIREKDKSNVVEISKRPRKRDYLELFKIGLILDDYQLIDRVKDEILPEDFEDIPPEEIKNYVSFNGDKSSIRYKRGFKMYKILKYLEENGPVRRKEIQKLAYELSHGRETFQPTEHRGWYGDWMETYRGDLLKVDETHNWYITPKGKKRLRELEKKFEV